MRRNHITANKEKMIVYRPSHLSGMKGGALWDNIVSGVKNALSWAKKNKLISKGLTAAAPLAGTYAPLALGAAGIADKFGYGKKKVGRPKKTMKGGMTQMTGRGCCRGMGVKKKTIKKKAGGSLNPAGMGLTLSGAGKKVKRGTGIRLAGSGKVKVKTVFP